MQKIVRFAVLLFIIFIVSLTMSWIYQVNQPNKASEQLIEDYAKKYLEEYKTLVEFYGGGLGNLSQFKFSEYYNVMVVVSSVHGAAVFFEPSSKVNIETVTVPERIEFYVWEVMREYSNDAFWDRQYPQGIEFENYIVSANLQIGDGITPTYFYVGEKTVATFTDDYSIKVMPLGRLRIDGVLKYENRMILKGSNDERDWLPKAAVIDAANEFLRIAKDLAVAEAGIRKIEGFDILREKAEQIERNKATGVYEGNEDLQRMHEQEFWEEVEQYGIHPEVAQGIITLAREKYVKKPWYLPFLEVLSKVVFDGIVLAIIASPFLFILNRWYEKKFPSKSKTRRRRKNKDRRDKPPL